MALLPGWPTIQDLARSLVAISGTLFPPTENQLGVKI